MAWKILKKINEDQESDLTKVINKDNNLDMIKEALHKNHHDSGLSNKCLNFKAQKVL